MKESPELTQAKLLSNALSDSMVKLFKAGQYGLVLVFVGMLLLLVSKISGENIISYIVGGIGALTIITVLYFFYVRDIQKMKQVNEQINKNKEIIDTAQKYALIMTDLAYDIHQVTIKNFEGVAQTIVVVYNNANDLKKIVEKYPVPGKEKILKLIENRTVVTAKDISVAILNTTHSTEKIIQYIRMALMQSDAEPLKKYLKQLEELKRVLENAKTINVNTPLPEITAANRDIEQSDTTRG